MLSSYDSICSFYLLVCLLIVCLSHKSTSSERSGLSPAFFFFSPESLFLVPSISKWMDDEWMERWVNGQTFWNLVSVFSACTRKLYYLNTGFVWVLLCYTLLNFFGTLQLERTKNNFIKSRKWLHMKDVYSLLNNYSKSSSCYSV